MISYLLQSAALSIVFSEEKRTGANSYMKKAKTQKGNSHVRDERKLMRVCFGGA
ncbi:hypothetical protein PB1_08882 [Bacillus methanolicus PB1]|uniref:Uncharacterized protein n=1 Tax=Bacillus methanolicus PB1 TaxID=997296 RepID=I3E1U1_BACMT|nr:hypothetical protein PB1_08882 [Bacillus methanolicus PB1]